MRILIALLLVGAAFAAKDGPFNGLFHRYSSAKVLQYGIKFSTGDDGTVIGQFMDGPYKGKTHLNTSLVYENDGAGGFINTFDPQTNETVLQAPFSVGISEQDGHFVGISQDAEESPYVYEGKVFFYIADAAHDAWITKNKRSSAKRFNAAKAASTPKSRSNVDA